MARPLSVRHGAVRLGLVGAVTLLAAACGPDPATAPASTSAVGSSADATTSLPTLPPPTGPPHTAPASPDVRNVYADTAAGHLSPATAGALPYVYVPSNDDGSVTVIDQRTFRVVRTFKVGRLVQHVVPSWDLRTLYAAVSGANLLVAIDPRTGLPGRTIPVAAPYNLYFTPDGRRAVVMAERLDRMDFYDTATWKLLDSTAMPCHGVNHADWSPDGLWFLATCEFSGQIVKVDTATGRVLGVLDLRAGSMPQDVRIVPDGSRFFVADMMFGGVWVVDGVQLSVVGFIPTGTGAHGIYPSRDGRFMYVSNRGRLMGDELRPSRPGEGSVSVIDPATDRVLTTWSIPNGGSPDMGGVTADGGQLWLSGRFDSDVYVFDTSSGRLLARIPVPNGPHGLCVWPQPGRYSLGHTGNLR